MGDLRVAAGFEARVERHGQAVAADRAVDDPALVGRDVNGVVEQQALDRDLTLPAGRAVVGDREVVVPQARGVVDSADFAASGERVRAAPLGIRQGEGDGLAVLSHSAPRQELGKGRREQKGKALAPQGPSSSSHAR